MSCCPNFVGISIFSPAEANAKEGPYAVTSCSYADALTPRNQDAAPNLCAEGMTTYPAPCLFDPTL